MKHSRVGRAVAVPAAARPCGRSARYTPNLPSDASFLSTLGELREATYSDKATIVERLSQSGHPSVRAVLTALLEDRLYFRNSDQKIFIVKSADEDPLNLIDPLSLKDAGSAPADSLTKIGTNNALRRTLRTTVAHFCVVEPGCGGAPGRGAGDVAVAGRRDRGAAARATRRGNEFQRQEGNRHGPGARCAGRHGHQGASGSDRHAEPKRQPGCAEPAGALAR